MRFLNIHHAEETIGRLVQAVTGTAPEAADLAQGYRAFINQRRPIAAPPSGIQVSFKESPWGDYLIANRTFENIFEGLADTPEQTCWQWSHDVLKGLEQTRASLPDLARLVDLVVSDVVLFSSKNKGGGSGSRVPGLVSMSPGDEWAPHDFAESLVHETVHLNAFLADMTYGLYTKSAKQLEEAKYRVVSAVKFGQMRPLDKAFHSAIVAPPLMLMQAERGETELVDKFSASLRECTDGLMDKLQYFTPYGQLLVAELRAFAVSGDLDLVRQSISSRTFAHYEMPATA